MYIWYLITIILGKIFTIIPRSLLSSSTQSLVSSGISSWIFFSSLSSCPQGLDSSLYPHTTAATLSILLYSQQPVCWGRPLVRIDLPQVRLSHLRPFAIFTMMRKDVTTFVVIDLKTWKLVQTYFGQVSNNTTLNLLNHMKNHTFVNGNGF